MFILTHEDCHKNGKTPSCHYKQVHRPRVSRYEQILSRNYDVTISLRNFQTIYTSLFQRLTMRRRLRVFKRETLLCATQCHNLPTPPGPALGAARRYQS